MSNARRRITPPSLPLRSPTTTRTRTGYWTGRPCTCPEWSPSAPDGSYVGIDDVQAQAVQVFENLKAVVEAAGGSLDDVVSTTTYLAAAEHAAAVGEVRKNVFTGPVPPTSTVVVAPMAREQFLVEVAAIAHIGG